MPYRRSLLAAAGVLLAAPSLAQERYPGRPVRMMIPVGVGGVTDIVGRILAEGMTPILGQPVVPENVVGAGSTIGAAAFHRTPADGYTIFIGTNNHPLMKALRPEFPHDPVTDFVPVALVGRQPFVLAVNPSVPAQDVAQLLAWLRRERDAANFGSTNPGATNHLAGELLKQLAGLDYTIVPYRTAALAVQDLVAGRMQFTIDSPTMLNSLIQAGQVRGLAVSSRDRSVLVPGLPSLAESGVPGYDLTAWQVLFAKPGTPAPIVATLEAAARRALADPAVQDRLRRAGVDTWPDTSAAAAAQHVREEVARWAPIAERIRQAGG
ncbi:Bug family tripartite tricarboxylate transporter substrate binding protein [Neoroseomonas soli]|uniref:Tripartite tricarboxylate transporter substrate binding protein n=1 Tax=Neoroseomonas soli TaxID=1081025 RepID=A0A9X9WRI0_9PROT|nr:tripartite tricarboxylate transporter substrate binding protein [Neoroseomonas soli]MBR0669759.1 tripartite tricarboxylate transporter substrate binding protein [Neoroseomonas soli]